MIDYGIRITLSGDAESKLRKIAAASRDVEVAAKSAGTSMRSEFARAAREQRAVIKNLEADYKRLRSAADQAAPGMAKLNVERQASSVRNELTGEKEYLEALMEARERYNAQTGSVNSRIYGLSALLRGAVGLYAAGVGVVGTFTKENEKLDQIQRRLAQALSVVIGLESASEAIKRMNVRQIGILTSVTKAWRSAQQALTRALWGSNVAANVLMGTLTLGLSVAIGVAIAAISKYRDAQKKSREEAEKARKAQLEFNKSVGQNASDSIVKFKQLQAQWERTGDSLSKRQEFIKKNKSAFEDLGASISKVSDAEKLFTSGEANFIQSLVNRARAMAATAKASEYLSEAVSASEDRKGLSSEISRLRSEREALGLDNVNIRSSVRGLSAADAAKVLEDGTNGLRKQEIEYLQKVVQIQQKDQERLNAIHKESEATRKATQLLKDNVDLTTKGEVDKSSYTPADVSDSLRGVSGNGGIKNFQITFNSPVVQIDDKHVEGEKYTPEQLGQTAAKEFVNILTQIAVQ